MADAEQLIERCMEEIATTVLDAGDAISYRTLGASSQVSVDISLHALHKFAQENESSVGAIEVVVQQGVTSSAQKSKKKSSSNSTASAEVDPRARVIRIGSFSPEQSAEKAISKQIYSVYKKTADDESDAVELVSIACWSQERSLRNDIFQKVAKQAPLSRAIKSFYESGIKCVEATTRTGFGDSQGEESVSIFDSLKAATKPSVFVSSAKSSINSTQSGASNGSKSFFKSSASATNAPKSRATSSASSSATRATPAAAKQPETKKIDAKSMSGVFTIDSDDDDDDDDDDGSDADAPVFVRKSSSTATTTKPRSKRVISDDEDEDDDDFVESSAKTPAPVVLNKKDKAGASRNVKRKLSTSPDEKKKKNHVSLSDSGEDQAEQPKRTKRATPIDEDDNVEEEEEPAEISTKRRVEVTKTRINEQGYMVTEKTVEEVELTAEEIEQEKLQAATKKKQQQAVAEAARAAAEKKAAVAAAAAAKGGAPAKQKNLFAFFTRK